ncbi:hypothetical protein BGZ98_006185 [Dissophora globulifera]|nr:hypothetical protein BGZ98_006185 [Dissophora globulifera]
MDRIRRVHPITSLKKTSWVSRHCPKAVLPPQNPIAEEDDLRSELERIQDPGALKERFYAEHQLMMDQLNMAGRFGLELQQSLEQAQRAERQSYAQIQALQDENLMLQSRVHHTQELSAHLTGSEDEVRNLTSENESLQKELDGCRRELKTFRKELDHLVEQMAEMGSEVLDAKSKVSMYSRRLTEVEQELNSTQELNVDLQEQLRVALEKHKQTHSNTAQVVKNMQTELGRVVSDSGTIRSTLEELESRQEKCEGRVVEMISNTKEYAQLLEEAQTTIQTMRIESDMDGRGWSTSPLSSSWDIKRSTGQLSTLAMEDPELNNSDFPAEEDPHAWSGELQGGASGMSLGMELSLGAELSRDRDQRAASPEEPEDQLKESIVSSAPSTPATYRPSPSSKQLTPAPSPRGPVAVHNKETQTPVPPPSPPKVESSQQQPTSPIPKDTGKFSTGSLSSELQQRLEEHNIFQTRPPWNPSVALENVLPSPTRNRSRSTSRGPSTSSSRSVSQASLHHQGSPASVSASFRNSRASTMPSPQTSPHIVASGSSSSLMDAISTHSGKRLSAGSSSSVFSNSHNTTSNNRPRSRTAAATVEKNPTPGLKYLLSTNNSALDLSNVITKTKASAAAAAAKSSSPGAARSAKGAKAGVDSSLKSKPKTATAGGTTTTASTKSGPRSNLTVESMPKTMSGGRASSMSPGRNVIKKKSSSSLSISPTPGALPTTGQTTPRSSHPTSPSFSPMPPASPSVASKKLQAISMTATESLVSSVPLMLPESPLPGSEDTTTVSAVALSEELESRV